MVIDYNAIKTFAKQEGLRVSDLIALTPGNDPFYVGSPGQMEKAHWGMLVYEGMGSPKECHVRRVHYWIVSQEPKIRKPNGDEYLNTIRDWEFLNLSLKYARYAGLVPIERFIDRRNPSPIVNAKFWENEIPSEVKEGIDAEELIELIADKFYCFNPHNSQPYLIELFCEKSTMNDILEPLCKKYGMNLVTGLGELSITAVRQLIDDRVQEADKPVRILYLSDFDPAGECMPVSVARKIEYFVRIASHMGYDIKLKPIVLTKEQCEEYELPRTPIKETEGRKGSFEARHGTGATELDALESLHPGLLEQIILSEVLDYFDTEAWNESTNHNRELYERVKEFLTENIEDVNEFVNTTLEDLDLSDLDDYEASVGDEFDDSDRKWLYDSDRPYVAQILEYKKFKGVH